jgi:ABC-type sugar transport system substrate-binding protein
MPRLKYSVLGICTVLILLIFLFVFNFLEKPSNKDDGIKYIIGVSQPNLMEPWRIAMNDEIKAEAAKHSDMKVVFYDAAQDNEKQKQDIENMVNQRIDLLIVSANDTDYLSETISKVFKQGIPVIEMEYPTKNENYTTLIYCDNKKIGRLAGEYVGELLGGNGGTVLEIQGEPDSPITIERKKGFREGISKFPNVKVAYVVVGYWLRDKTEARVDEIYKKEPKVDVIFAHNDAMALGAWRVAAKDDLKAKIVGIDGMTGKLNGLDAVKKGILNCTYIYPTGGKEAVDIARRILNGEKVPKQLELQTVKVTRDNVDELIK